MHRSLKSLLVVLPALALLACGQDTKPVDACANITCGAGEVCSEGICVATDGGAVSTDAGTDAGVTTDAGTDGGVTTDAGTDAGLDLDAGALASEQIAQVRAAAPDAGMSLPIEGAWVTYIRPTIGSDPGGYFLQARQAGPGIFVQEDAGLSDVPAKGELATLTVSDVAVVSGMRRITAVTAFDAADGGPMPTLVREVSNATDLVSALDSYESTLVTATGTLATPMGNAGAPFVSADFETAGITGQPDLEFRTLDTIRDALDLAQGCVLTVTGTPMGRFNARAQLTAYDAAEVTVQSCPAPEVQSAIATSPTTVVVNFTRQILASSLLADGSQFTFDKNLTATAAALTGPKTVTLTTGTQTGGEAYLLTVASSITDTHNVALATGSGRNTATFNGYVAPATLLLSEVNPNVPSSGGGDLLELVAKSAGSVNGYQVQQIGTTNVITIVTLPDIIVAQDDILLIHFANGTVETTAKDQHLAATNPGFVDTAWDVGTSNSGLAAGSSRILQLVHPDGTTVTDAVPFVAPSSMPSATFLAGFDALVAANLWTATCLAATCTEAEVETFGVDWTGLDATQAGASLYRLGTTTDTNSKADWARSTSSTFGASN